MKKEITVTVNGKKVLAYAGDVLSEIIGAEKPCGGHGKCGKCKVIAKGNLSASSNAELKLLTQDEMAQGIRLSCVACALGDCVVETIDNVDKPQIATDGVMNTVELAPMFSDYGIAVDIGTTTIVASLYDIHGNVLSEASCLNPQSQWGADVISRVEAALDGKGDLLANAVRDALCDIIVELTATIDAEQVDAVVITGNTVMLSLLSEQTVAPFSYAPFAVERLFGEKLTAERLSLSVLSPDTLVYLPPCISAFVGADITCALLATEIFKQNIALLVDIGTNGEIALWHDGKLTVCSTAAGPALEGVGISMGMRGAAGAIDKVVLQDGKMNAHTICDREPKGICGSGLVDAVACMLDGEVIDESGYLEEDPFVIREPVTLTAKDVRMLQLAKSAICAGILTLLEENGVKPTDVSVLYIAGGFGNYLNKENAVKIGLLPETLAGVSQTVGNAALGGASMLLLNSNMKAITEKLSQDAKVQELSSNPVFAEHYITGMLFGKI